jgi:predicted PurR-regulated permease PerM
MKTTPTEADPPENERVARLVKGCVILLLLAVIIFSRTIAVPVLGAVLLSIALFPVVNRAAHMGIPRALASLSVVLGVVAIGGGILYLAREPLAQLGARVPQIMGVGQQLLMRAVGRHESAASLQPHEPEALVDALAPVLAGMTASLVAIGTSLVLGYFILTYGTGVGRAALAAVRHRHERRNWLRVCGAIRTQAAHYLQLVTVINACFGLVTGVVLTLLHVNDAAAYGVIAGLMNFIPIVGALITSAVVLAGGIAEHGVTTVVLLPPAAFLMLHIIESQFVTPLLLGRRLLLNPLIVIAGVLIGATAWGRGGAFLAVPILTSAKIALDAHPRFRRWGQVLGRGAVVDCQTDEARRVRLRRRAGARRQPQPGS